MALRFESGSLDRRRHLPLAVELNGSHLSVLHVSEPVDGGVPHVLRDFVDDQVRRGWRVAVASPPAPAFVDAIVRAGAEHVAWRLPVRLVGERSPNVPVVALVRELRALRRAIRERDPDVLHLHSSTAGLGGRLAVRGSIPTVFQPHAWSFLAVDGLARRAALQWERFAARWTAVVVCVSEAERELGREAGINARFSVIPNGVDLHELGYASEDDRRSARTRLGVDDSPLVVCVGGLRRQKGQDVLLDAWPRVREHVPDARLALVGDGPDRVPLERRAAPRVVFAGDRPDVADWLAAADLVALPSRWEGMSLVLLEAMARGRSIVATDVPGVREALGEAGTVVPAESVEPLAHALVERLVHPERAAREGRIARERAEQSHDVRRACAHLAALYAELVNGAREARA